MRYFFWPLRSRLLVGLCLSGMFLLAGCDRSSPSESGPVAPAAVDQHAQHQDHAALAHPAPADFTAGVQELKQCYLKIKQAFAASDSHAAIEQADEPLHRVGEILEVLPDLAQKTQLTHDDLQSVKKSVDAMFEAYGDIDGAVHAGKTPDYQAAAKQLDEAMSVLENAVPPPGKPVDKH